MRRWVGWAALLLTGCGSTADQPTTGVTPASLIGEALPVTTCALKPSPNVFRVVVDAAGIHVGGALVVSTTELDGHTMGLPELAAVIPKGCNQAVITATAHSSWGAFGRAAMTLQSAGVDHVFVEAAHHMDAGVEVGSFEVDVPHPGPDRMVTGIDMEAYVGPHGVRLHSDDLGNSATLTVQGVAAAAVRYKPRTGPGVATVMANVAADVQAYISVRDALAPSFATIYDGFAGDKYAP
jgi:hypothetical protein